MEFSPLTALSPLDGRYQDKVAALRTHFSEYGLIRNRIRVEIAWLQALAQAPGLQEIPEFSPSTRDELAEVVANFSVVDADQVKAIEARTNHDVKAMEYWLKERLGHNGEVMRVSEFIHFACTSEDINNTSHALMLSEARADVLLPALDKRAGAFSNPAALRACDVDSPCRDDYICARSGSERGVCLPPYFLFQLRVDGHPG